MRSIWKGYLRFSLVTIPIRVYNAVDTTQRVRFTQLHVADNGIAFRFETINMPFLHIRSKKLFKKAFQSNS